MILNLSGEELYLMDIELHKTQTKLSKYNCALFFKKGVLDSDEFIYKIKIDNLRIKIGKYLNQKAIERFCDHNEKRT